MHTWTSLLDYRSFQGKDHIAVSRQMLEPASIARIRHSGNVLNRPRKNVNMQHHLKMKPVWPWHRIKEMKFLSPSLPRILSSSFLFDCGLNRRCVQIRVVTGARRVVAGATLCLRFFIASYSRPLVRPGSPPPASARPAGAAAAAPGPAAAAPGAQGRRPAAADRDAARRARAGLTSS
jgi:hypothetical protein